MNEHDELKPRPKGWNFYCECGNWLTSPSEPWHHSWCDGPKGESTCPLKHGGSPDYDRGHFAIWGENWTTVVLSLQLERAAYEYEQLYEAYWTQKWGSVEAAAL